MAHTGCWFLQDHLEFSIDSDIRVCCFRYRNSDGETRGNVPLVKITGNRFPAEEIRAARAQILSEIAAGTHLDCMQCPLLETADWVERGYLADKVTMNPWTHCNLKCVYCFTLLPEYTNKKVAYDITAVIADMLRGKHLDPSGYITWGGGDISALPEFDGISQLFQDYGVRQDFKTSAFKFLPGVADALKRKLGVVEVSLDAGTKKTYASYKGRDAFERVVSNIRRYRECGPVRLKYIADCTNVSDQDIDGFCSIASSINPEIVTVTAEWNSAYSKKYEDDAITQIAKLLHSLWSTGVPCSPSRGADGRNLLWGIWPRVQERLANL